MPNEENIIDIVLHTESVNETFDPTVFIESENVTVSVKIDSVGRNTYEAVDITIDPKHIDANGNLDESSFSVDEMFNLIDKYNICWVYQDRWEKGTIDDFVYLENELEFGYKTESLLALNENRDEIWISNESDYERCVDTDVVYENENVANNNNCHYCDSCENFRADTHDFDNCNNNSDDEYFDNTTTSSKSLSIMKGWGTDSLTYSISNGMKYTFGVEIETSNGNIDYDDRSLNLKSVYDGSTSGPEYVTGVLRGDYGFNHFKKICNVINNNNHEVNSKCGVHVHIGGVFNRRFTIMLLRLCYQIQDEVYRMMPLSRCNNSFCKPIPTYASQITFQNFREELGKYVYGDGVKLDKNHNKKCSTDHYSSTRYRWVNINNFSTRSGKPTVEFRNHGCSTSYEKIRNWILICMSIVKYAENNQRKIYFEPETISLMNVIYSSLGTNLGNQVYHYYLKRVEKFEQVHLNNRHLPSSIISRDTIIV